MVLTLNFSVTKKLLYSFENLNDPQDIQESSLMNPLVFINALQMNR